MSKPLAESEKDDKSALFRFNHLLDFTIRLIQDELPEGYRVEAARTE